MGMKRRTRRRIKWRRKRRKKKDEKDKEEEVKDVVLYYNSTHQNYNYTLESTWHICACSYYS